MMFQKPKVALQTNDARTTRELRSLIAAWCDLESVQDLKSIEKICKDGLHPAVLIAEVPGETSPSIANASGIRDEQLRLFSQARERFPTMRRVLIADAHDLATTIHCLHSGAVDSLLHRPFDSAGVLTALRLQKPQAAPASASEFVNR